MMLLNIKLKTCLNLFFDCDLYRQVVHLQILFIVDSNLRLNTEIPRLSEEEQQERLLKVINDKSKAANF